MNLDDEYEKHLESLKNTDLNNHKFKSSFASISDDVRDIIVESGNIVNVSPKLKLVIISIVNLDEDNPCGVCKEAYDQLIQWGLDYGSLQDRKAMAIAITPNTDDLSRKAMSKKMWSKLNVDFSNVPRHFIFDSKLRLVDIVDGIMTGNYIETFYGELING